MSVLSYVLSGFRPGAAKLDRGDDGRWREGGPTFAQKSVTPKTTLELSTAWACVRLNARTIGSLPLKLYERTSATERRSAEAHPLYSVLKHAPNPDQSAMEFWEGQTVSLNLRGNAYARIGRRGDDQVVALWPMNPDAVQVIRSAGGERCYKYWNGQTTEELSARDVFHLRGFGAGGDEGLSPIAYGRQTLGTALAAEEVAGSTFANGLQMAGFVEMALGKKLTEEQRADMLSLFEKFSGSKRTGKVMPLPEGAKFVPLKMTAADAQLLESRRFSVEDICRWFGVFPILIGHSAQGQTMWGSGVEQIMLAWRVLGLGPELTRIEQAIAQQLILPGGRGRFYAEFVDEGLLRADSAGRAALYSSAGQNGWMDRNEIRSKENLAPRAGGDVLTVQSNLVRLDQLGASPSAGQQARDGMLAWLKEGEPQPAQTAPEPLPTPA